MSIIINVLIAIVINFFSIEASIAYWRYSVGLSVFQTFIAEIIFNTLSILCWFWLFGKTLAITEKWQKGKNIPRAKKMRKILLKLARWITKKRKIYERHQNKKIVKRLKALGHFGVYLCGIIPSFTFFVIGLSIQEVFVQSRYGRLCLWLGTMTRVTIGVFVGSGLINLLIKLIN